MVTAIMTKANVSFQDQTERVNFTIDSNNLQNSTAKISKLNLIFTSEALEWKISRKIPLAKVPKLITKNFFYIKIIENDGLYKLLIERNVKLQSLETFTSFLRAIEQEASRHHLYPILTQMVTLYDPSGSNHKDSAQLQKIFSFLTSKDQLQYQALAAVSSKERYKEKLLGQSLYGKAVKNAFPEVVAMHRQSKELDADADLKDNAPYVHLDGELPSSPPGKPLSELLDEVLLSSKRIVILGEAGSGKSLFLKRYTRNLLKEYCLGEPSPFYIDLSKIKKREAILTEYLKKYDLNEQHLKGLNCIFFCDGYDELIEQDRDKLFNIFIANHLHTWPKAKFVFSCRNIFNVFELEEYFAPSDDRKVVQLDICSLNWQKIKFFLQKYTDTHSGWSFKQYLDNINRLGLNQLIKHPFHLRCAADRLPLLNRNILEKGNKELFFWGMWVCSMIWREFNKIRTTSTKRPVDYLNYILEVAHLMQLCGVRALSNVPEAHVSINIENSIQAYNKSIEILLKEKNARADELENHPPEQPIDKKITAIDDQIKELQSLIEQVQSAPQKLQQLLFNKINAPWQSKALLINKRDRVEFTYPYLCDYLAQINQDLTIKNLLIQQLNSFK